MCGIYGMVSLDSRPLRYPDRLERMGAKLRHRGPDGHGVRQSTHAAFGVERLRIVDLHSRADQPFAESLSDVWIACNGQVYNAPDLRSRFPRYRLRSRSDVEVILPLYLSKGLQGLADLEGMFAIACWDGRRRTLALARDRVGEKPLFYLRDQNEVWFASEIQALLEHPTIARDINGMAAHSFLMRGFVTEPHTMFSRIERAETGSITEFTAGRHEVFRYFDPRLVMQAPEVSPSDAVPRLRTLLENAVARQTQADVPVGVFTSGGVDSSLIAAIAARVLGPERTHTFTVRLGERSYDEGANARRVVTKLGTHHVEAFVNQREMLFALHALTRLTAEPLGDPATLPTHLLARTARKHVGVVLGGEGADELFGGYPTYLGHLAASSFTRLPPYARRLIGTAVNALPVSTQKVPVEFLLKRFVAAAHHPWRTRHISWFGTGLPESALSQRLRASVERPIGRRVSEPSDPAGAAMLLDFQTYLRDNLLVKVDRATMGASLEARSPYLDREVAEFGLALDTRLKIRGGTTKWVLRQAAAAWLPQSITRRRKRGLSLPVGSWVNNGLRDEVDRLLAPARLHSQGLVDPAAVDRLLREHRGRRANHARALWTIFTFQVWLEQWAPEAAHEPR